jgi:hypothetical protein
VNPTRARKRIRALVRLGRIRFTEYCALRMLERGIEALEVSRLLLSAPACHAQANGRWRIPGEELTAIVELVEDAVVVTLFRGDEDDED